MQVSKYLISAGMDWKTFKVRTSGEAKSTHPPAFGGGRWRSRFVRSMAWSGPDRHLLSDERRWSRAAGLPVAELLALPAPPVAERWGEAYVCSNFFSDFWLILGKLWEARSRAYRSRCLQVNSNYYLLVWKLLTRSTRLKTRFYTAPNSKIQLKFVKHVRIFAVYFPNFSIFFEIN